MQKMEKKYHRFRRPRLDGLSEEYINLTLVYLLRIRRVFFRSGDLYNCIWNSKRLSPTLISNCYLPNLAIRILNKNNGWIASPSYVALIPSSVF